jgi:ABC-type antimicrobial peptide transport system ATPase subunit
MEICQEVKSQRYCYKTETCEILSHIATYILSMSQKEKMERVRTIKILNK